MMTSGLMPQSSSLPPMFRVLSEPQAGPRVDRAVEVRRSLAADATVFNVSRLICPLFPAIMAMKVAIQPLYPIA